MGSKRKWHRFIQNFDNKEVASTCTLIMYTKQLTRLRPHDLVLNSFKSNVNGKYHPLIMKMCMLSRTLIFSYQHKNKKF